VGYILHTAEIRNAYQVLLGKPEGKRSFARPRHRQEDKPDIKMGLKETGCKDAEWFPPVHFGIYSWSRVFLNKAIVYLFLWNLEVHYRI
jgi:hypothetical protein